MGVGHRRAFGIGPHVIADEAADCNIRCPREDPQIGFRIEVNLTFRRRIETAASKYLAVETNVFAVRPVETELVVALSVVFHKAGT